MAELNEKDLAKNLVFDNIHVIASFLLDTMNDKNAKLETRVSCAKELIDWSYGKDTIETITGATVKPFELQIQVLGSDGKVVSEQLY